MKKTIRVGVIGLGQRGMQLIEPLLKMEDVRIVAICDPYADRVENAAGTVTKAGFPEPFQTDDYRELLSLENLDAVVIATSWEHHIEIAMESMKKRDFYGHGGRRNLPTSGML